MSRSNQKSMAGRMAALVCLALTMSFVSASPVKAVSLTELQVAELNAAHSANSVYQNAGDCIQLDYVGSDTEAVVTVNHASMTVYSPTGYADASVGSSGVLSFASASYDTVGEICDHLDAAADFKCSLTGCKRDDAPALLRDQTATSGTNDLKAAGGFDVLLDTGSTAGDQLTGVYVIRQGLRPPAGQRVTLKKINFNCNGANTIKVYGKLKRFEGINDGITRGDTTLAWNQVIADDTDTSIDFTVGGAGKGVDFAKDAHVVVSCGNSTSIQASGNFVNTIWESK